MQNWRVARVESMFPLLTKRRHWQQHYGWYKYDIGKSLGILYGYSLRIYIDLMTIKRLGKRQERLEAWNKRPWCTHLLLSQWLLWVFWSWKHIVQTQDVKDLNSSSWRRGIAEWKKVMYIKVPILWSIYTVKLDKFPLSLWRCEWKLHRTCTMITYQDIICREVLHKTMDMKMWTKNILHWME